VTVRDPAGLDRSPAEARALAQAVLDRVLAHLAELPGAPACGDVDPERAAALCRTLREGPPEEGAPIESLLAPLFDEWVPRSFTTNGPGYLAYIPGGGLFESALADLIADTTNRFTGTWPAAPALVQLEANVLEWFREWMGMPPGTAGLLTSGGSLANFAAIVAAREQRLGAALREGVLYTSQQAHLCIGKAARLAGILPDRVRALPVDEHFRLRVDALEEAVAADRRAGLQPFLVVSTAGTTNTGAVDPLEAVADVCAREGLWHHVDGAYGAFFHMVPELRPLLAGLSRADSLALDPHTGLFLPYGTGAVLVRDGQALRAAHAATAGYLPAVPDDVLDPSQYGPELSRPFRGLRVWLPVKLLGTARLRAAVAEKRALALHAAERIAQVPGLALVAPPQLSLLAFRCEWPGSSAAQRDDATRRLLAAVNARQRVMLSGCTAGGSYLARICVLSFRTRRDRVQAALDDVAAEAEALLGARARAR
jgi:aromatic-L-amino-acid/L-tryptophan decarboxylase